MVEVFCKEYAQERSRLNVEADQWRSALKKELATANRDHGKLVDAGIPAEQVKVKKRALTERREALVAQLAHTQAPDPIRIHPKMAANWTSCLRGLCLAFWRLLWGAKRKIGLSLGTQAFDSIDELVFVAGGRNRRNLPTLNCVI